MMLQMRLARKIPIGVAAVGLLLQVGAGAAFASTGIGTFDNGWEVPSQNVSINNGAHCAHFHSSPGTDDTTHTLPMTGSFLTTSSGSGTATMTITNAWYAQEEGTYDGNQCINQATVAGTLTLTFSGGWSCTGGTNAATYERRNETDYTVLGTVSCSNGGSPVSVAVAFTGQQVLCGASPRPTCNDVDAGTNLDGDYSWTS
jgi:uncharacterized cupin superfamily protein